MAVDLNRYGIKVRRYLIRSDDTYEPLEDELPNGAWLWKTLVGGTVELYRSGPPPSPPRRVPLIELLPMVAVAAVALAALPVLLVAVGIVGPIAVVTLMVWAVVRAQAQRRR